MLKSQSWRLFCLGISSASAYKSVALVYYETTYDFILVLVFSSTGFMTVAPNIMQPSTNSLGLALEFPMNDKSMQSTFSVPLLTAKLSMT